MIKYVEFCAGGGGMRAGLDAAGWECAMALDNDPDAVAVHRLAHGDAQLADVTSINQSDIPEVDAWVAGFPCQPFSSSGNRHGFGHKSGNVFEHLTRLISEKHPQLLLFENVEGLLTNKEGHTMAVILMKLTELNYIVSWCLIDLRWFGVPQSRPRLFLVAHQPGSLKGQSSQVITKQRCSSEVNIFSQLLQKEKIGWKIRHQGSLSATEQILRPAIGKPRSKNKYMFGRHGLGTDDLFESFDLVMPKSSYLPSELGPIVAPNFSSNDCIRSIRYWTTDSGRGPTKLYLRPEPTSHCIGTSLGGAPLFAVPLHLVKNNKDRNAFLEYSNWQREQDGMLVMRLRPNRAVLLFGPHTNTLHQALTEWDVGDTRKYKVVGNLVAPACAKAVAQLISEQFNRRAGCETSKNPRL